MSTRHIFSPASSATEPTRDAVLIKEYGVIHIKNALTGEEQRELWRITKPRVADPASRATGFSNFSVSEKNGKGKRTPEFDAYGTMLFKVAAEELVKQMPSESECSAEPSYKRLHDIWTGKEAVQLDQIFGNYYRPDAKLMNHCDSDEILFTMSVALGDDCDFAIGKPTGRRGRMSERNGKEFNIRMKCGDAIFFDGGLVPHEVKRVIPDTAPAWWGKEKVEHGSRCVVIFREGAQDFYKNRLGAR